MKFYKIFIFFLPVFFFCNCATQITYYDHKVLKTIDLKYETMGWSGPNPNPLFVKKIFVFPFNDLRKIDGINMAFKEPFTIEFMNMVSNYLISGNICTFVEPATSLFGVKNRIILNKESLALLHNRFQVDGVISGSIKRFDYMIDNSGDNSKLIFTLEADVFYAASDGLIKAEKVMFKQKAYSLDKKYAFFNPYEFKQMDAICLDFLSWAIKGEINQFVMLLYDKQKHLNIPCHRLIYKYSSAKILKFEDYVRISKEERNMKTIESIIFTSASFGIPYGIVAMSGSDSYTASLAIVSMPLILLVGYFVSELLIIQPTIREKVNNAANYAYEQESQGFEFCFNFLNFKF